MVAPGCWCMNSTSLSRALPAIAPVPGSRSAEAPVPGPRRRWPQPARLLSPLVLVVLWQAASMAGLISGRTLASPAQILITGWGLLVSGELPWHMLVSLGRVAAGLTIGLSIGTALGLVAGLSRLGETIVDAPVQMLR